MSASSSSNSREQLSRQAGTVGGLTLLSRIAGLIRDMVIARLVGTQAMADAFYVAFRIPNLMRRLLAEGALTMAFVPIYADYRRQGDLEARRAVDTIFTALVLLLIALVIIGIACAPWIVQMIAYGFTADPHKFALTVSLTRVMFPYLMLVSLMALMMALLNSWRHFLAPAASPIVLNIAMILAAVFATRWFLEPTYGLAVGVLAGGAAQLAVQLPPLLRRGLLPRFVRTLRHPSLRQLIRIMIPAAYGGAVYQLNVLVVTLLASFLPTGSVSYLWYADRITEFPLGIFAVALATVTLPALADQQSDGAIDQFKQTMNFSLRIAMAEAVPSAAGLVVLATPIVRMLFEAGKFGPDSVAGTAGALTFFALGIPWVSGVRTIVPAFYAMKDPRTPVRMATIGLVVNALVAALLMHRLAHQGLALAMAISAAVHFLLLCTRLRRRLGLLGGRRIVHSLVRTCVASTIMAVVVGAASHALRIEARHGRLAVGACVFACIGLGILVYVPLMRRWNPEEYAHLTAMFSRRMGRRRHRES